MTDIIHLDQVTKRFGDVTALDNVSLAFRENTITGLLGRNGAGKTVTMSLITAQDTPTSGAVTVAGHNPWENSDVLAKTCFIRDTQRYPAEFRLEHLLRVGPACYPQWDDVLARRIAGEFTIPGKRNLKRLSRGQLSAVAILIGMASRAPITIFDEPYLGLDATARTIFYELLIEDYAERPRTFIISTHLIDEMDNLFEDMVLLNQGRIRASGNVESFRSRALRLSGAWDRLEPMLTDLTVLKRQRMGAVGAAIVETTPQLTAQASAAGLSTEPVSLHELVAAYGLNPDKELAR